MHGESPRLLFLHGNVAVGYNDEIVVIGMAGTVGKRYGKYYEPTKLMFPVKHKNYTDDAFIKQQWVWFEHALQHAARVTVFGYSAPKSDVEAISAMKNAWGSPQKRNMEQFEFIDVRKEDDIVASWDGFIHTHHYDYCTDFFQSSLGLFPRRTYEAFRCQYMFSTEDEAFIEPVPIPSDRIITFEEMWEWFEPLIKVEEKFIKEN